MQFVGVLQRVAACCSMLQHVAVSHLTGVLSFSHNKLHVTKQVLYCNVLVYCSVLQRVAACGSVLQYVAVCHLTGFLSFSHNKLHVILLLTASKPKHLLLHLNTKFMHINESCHELGRVMSHIYIVYMCDMTCHTYKRYIHIILLLTASKPKHLLLHLNTKFTHMNESCHALERLIYVMSHM